MRVLRLIGLVLVLAVACHLATIWLMPRILLAAVTTTMQANGLPVNELVHFDRRTAKDRAIVRPSPDLLYSICLYDLSLGPVHIATTEMPQTYWSISGYAANTDNFFVVNDRDAAGRPVDILIGHADQRSSSADYLSPSVRGVILLRMVVESNEHQKVLGQFRNEVVCEPAS
ncbi:MAG: DUF1254 domain-containing protein [Alphaproteobacteria bacterium]|nr:MAG: DUF1254 domain-containing protein [Alphaproteobacteria bacterium]